MHVTAQVTVFHLEIRPERSRVVMELEGEVDCGTVPRVTEALGALRNVGWDEIVVDLDAVSFIDSAGLRMLLSQDARARDEGWRLELHGRPPALERLLAVTGLQDWFART